MNHLGVLRGVYTNIIPSAYGNGVGSLPIWELESESGSRIWGPAVWPQRLCFFCIFFIYSFRGYLGVHMAAKEPALRISVYYS